MKKYKINALMILFMCVVIALQVFSAAAVATTGNDEAIKTPTKKIALTFDDGPHPRYTAEVLNILKEKDVRATFFTVGFRAELLPHLILKIQNQGCTIGNHTYDHKDLTHLTDADVVSDLDHCSEVIFSITGSYPTIYRPPFGKINTHTETNIVMRKMLWDIDSLDWKTKSAARIIENICRDAKDGDIILMHDFYPQTVEALPAVIDRLKEKGFEFVIFDD